MRLPGWIVQEGKGRLSDDGRHVVLTFRVRRWYPRFWIALLRLRGAWRRQWRGPA